METVERYINKGHKILDKKYWEEWDKIVPIRCSDLYGGMELDDCLEIIKEINDGASYEYVNHLFNSQNHSGVSATLVKSLVINFCEDGEDYMNIIS